MFSEVTEAEGDAIGSAFCTFTENDPPSGGRCEIAPVEGVFFTTPFNISCSRFVDFDTPLKYSFYFINTKGDREYSI